VTTPPISAATRENSRVALVTCEELPDLWEDDHPLRDALIARGVTVSTPRWDDDIDWSAFDLTVLRSPWDYTLRRDAFVAWAGTVPHLANPADIVAWNTDKRYLAELAAAGVPVTPTTFIGPDQVFVLPEPGEWVVKPSISAGSRDTGRYHLPAQAAAASAHVRRLQAAGRTVLIQPFLSAVDTAGETALLFLPDAGDDLTFSHAIRKGPILTGPDGGPEDKSAREKITPRTATDADLDVAAQALAAIPGGAARLLYARVDVIPGPDGSPLLVELELTEPSLFLLHADGAADRLADAILRRL
jgi:hypothetical protein